MWIVLLDFVIHRSRTEDNEIRRQIHYCFDAWDVKQCKVYFKLAFGYIHERWLLTRRFSREDKGVEEVWRYIVEVWQREVRKGLDDLKANPAWYDDEAWYNEEIAKCSEKLEICAAWSDEEIFKGAEAGETLDNMLEKIEDKGGLVGPMCAWPIKSARARRAAQP